MTQKLTWQVVDDAEAVAQTACQRILIASERAIQTRGSFHLVLAGGRTPERTYQLLRAQTVDWTYWHIYYGDERCLPTEANERNNVMTNAIWLNHVPIPTEHVHPIPAQFGAVVAAPQYAQIIKRGLPFDMVLLGIGEDGHTASLFPKHVHSATELVHAVFNAPKPPPERVSLSAKALSTTRELIFLIAGASKREAVTAWKRGEILPVAEVCPQGEGVVLIDREANE